MTNSELNDDIRQLRAASAEYVGALRSQIEEIENAQRVYDENHGALELSIMLAGVSPLLVRSIGNAVSVAGTTYQNRVSTVLYVLERTLESRDTKQKGDTQ